MTIFQLALIAAGIANPSGQLPSPTLEADTPPRQPSQVCSPETAARVREMMRTVVDSGTAARAFAPLKGRVTSGGKTGTAQRIVTVYDPKTGKPRTFRDRKGEEHILREESIDALYMGFAPYENPQIAFAMIVENGGHGGTAAAPIAVGLIQRAVELGLVKAAAPEAQRDKPAAGRPAAGRPASRRSAGAGQSGTEGRR
jgi:penicillin-binding protein 2